MYREVTGYIRENRMIEKGDVVLAGVSGGGDSVTMLYILKEYRKELDFTLRAVHVHHGIRGKEADRDSRFVEELCSRWGIPCKIYSYNVPELSNQWKMGEEETGRLVRKRAFSQEGETEKNQGKTVRIALAHNQEDLAETMLHNLCRGTGLRGLCTMRPVTNDIIRPVLCLSRVEISAFLKQNRIPYIQDSTNASDMYTRNRIRHHVLPILEEQVNSKAAAHMVETAARLAQAEDYLCTQAAAILKEYDKNGKYCFTQEFFGQPQIMQIYALQQAMEKLAGRRKDLSSVHFEKVLELWQMQTGRKISLPYGMEAVRTYKEVMLHLAAEKTFDRNDNAEWKISVPGETLCPYGRIQTEIFLYTGQKIEEKKYTKWLDYDKIKKNPCIRTRKEGDFIVINTRGDKKKLRRCMIDEKIPSDERDKIPLIACEDEILWIVGKRISERYKITPQTRKVLELKYQGGHKNE